MGTGEVLSTTGGGHLPGIWAPVHVTGAQKVGAGPAPGGGNMGTGEVLSHVCGGASGGTVSDIV